MDIFGVKALKKLAGRNDVAIGDLKNAVYSYNWQEGLPLKEIIPKKNEERLNQHQADLDILAWKVDSIEPTVECETCGCLLRKATAYKGESVIDKVCGGFHFQGGLLISRQDSETIRERYYCKVHKAKK